MEREKIVISSSSEEEVKGNMIFPRMMLRVLLVEADDSTRQIIAALLRKCTYRVAAVADGLKAWQMLKGRPHNVDLILTEVELPSISGYALLSLIMEHDICKNIPVIMMSSKDSISVVLKCMLKGAADYLIKPIRKNELKNLWQHVWRRQINEGQILPECKNFAREKVEVPAEDNEANNHSSDNLASAGRNGHYRKKCSDSQSSCGTPELEAEIAYKPSMQGNLQVKLENLSSTSNTRKHEQCAKMVKKAAIPKNDSGDGEIVASYHGVDMMVAMGLREDHSCAESMPNDTETKPDSYGESNCQACALAKPVTGAVDVNGKCDGYPAGLDGHFHKEDSTKKVGINPKLELSLRQIHPSYTKDELADGHTFHLSKASAFSRYDSKKVLRPLFPVPASNFALQKRDTNSSQQQSFNELPAFCNTLAHSPAPFKGQENMAALILGKPGQSEAVFPGFHLGFSPIPVARFDSEHSSYDYLYPPIYYMQPGFPSFWSQKSHHEESTLPSSSSIHSTSEVSNSGQTIHPDKESTLHCADRVPDDEKLEMEREVRNGSPSSDLSNGFTYELSNTLSGTLCSTIEGNHVQAAAVATPTESVNDNGLLVHRELQGKYSKFSSQRQAALIKFRLKRKERCYEKKVRYQSRKRLAEQRPRVKGQFVRHAPNETLPLDAADDGP